jgi:Trypsin-like peptidase domain
VECDDGVSLDTGGASADFNFHADHLTKDHAVLHLKNPVSLSTAKALEVRDSAAKKDEKLFAVGHPYGQPRMVSPLTVSFVKNGAGYSYIHSQGYVYGGNSGGPLLDAEGKVVGMMVATDDKKYGPPQKREPLVTDEKTGMMCRTQDASSTIETEAVGFGTEIRKALEGQASPAAVIRTEGEEGAYR